MFPLDTEHGRLHYRRSEDWDAQRESLVLLGAVEPFPGEYNFVAWDAPASPDAAEQLRLILDDCGVGLLAFVMRSPGDAAARAFHTRWPERVRGMLDLTNVAPADADAAIASFLAALPAPDAPERWDAYHRDGTKTGGELLRGHFIPVGLYHLVSEVLVRHADGRFLLMRRDGSKLNYPGWYELTAGGSALRGETAEDAARRELLEETGLFAATLRPVNVLVSDETRTIYHEFFCEVSCPPDSVLTRPGETTAYRWVTKAELETLFAAQEIVPTVRERMALYFNSAGY